MQITLGGHVRRIHGLAQRWNNTARNIYAQCEHKMEVDFERCHRKSRW